MEAVTIDVRWRFRVLSPIKESAAAAPDQDRYRPLLQYQDSIVVTVSVTTIPEWRRAQPLVKLRVGRYEPRYSG